MTKSKVYSYLRFSDVKQASGSSIERQTDYAKRWAEKHGLELDSSLTLRDEGLSAYHQRHVKSGALGVFLVAVDEGRIAPGSYLVVEGLDRLSRAEPIQAQAQLAQIINAGITVVTASDGREYNRERLKAQPMDLVYSLLVMIRAHEESDTKSKRVKASIRKLCQRWQDGSYRGPIRNGKDPAWVRLEGGRFVIEPNRAEGIRQVIRHWLLGHGFSSMMLKLKNEGSDLSHLPRNPIALYRALRSPTLIGYKTLEIDGETFSLKDYYPPLVERAEWDEIQVAIATRHRAKGKSSITSIVTGLGITICGYCGRAMMSQNLTNRPKKLDGTPQDGHRRINCSGGPARCDVSASCSAAPVERAIVEYCSDQINLDRLTRNDSDGTRQANAALAAIRHKIAETEKKLEKLTDAMLADDSGEVPTVFVRRIREYESTLSSLKQEEDKATAEVTNQARQTPNQSEAWRTLAKAALAMDDNARMQMRQLVADTFERIVLYNSGMVSGETRTSPIDIVLVAKGGKPRLLRIDRRSGQVKYQDDFS
jgi:DNA invertase Pin-like site-specific DNA recombinase